MASGWIAKMRIKNPAIAPTSKGKSKKNSRAPQETDFRGIKNHLLSISICGAGGDYTYCLSDDLPYRKVLPCRARHAHRCTDRNNG